MVHNILFYSKTVLFDILHFGQCLRQCSWDIRDKIQSGRPYWHVCQNDAVNAVLRALRRTKPKTEELMHAQLNCPKRFMRAQKISLSSYNHRVHHLNAVPSIF